MGFCLNYAGLEGPRTGDSNRHSKRPYQAVLISYQNSKDHSNIIFDIFIK